MNKTLLILDKVCLYGGLVWIILGFFLSFFKNTWYMFFILTILHYTINQKWLSILKLSAFFIIIRLLVMILPIWAVQLMVIGLFIYIVYFANQWVKANDSDITTEAKIISAKAQLLLIKKLKKKGHTVDKSLIKELKGVINGKRKDTKQGTNAGTVN